MDKVLELNNILDKEIEFCENFENLLLHKKELLIHSKAFELKEFDEKILNAQEELNQINQNRINITKKFGDEHTKLSEIINNLEDRTLARELEIKRNKIQTSAKKISIINTVINSLIEHALKMIDGVIFNIADEMKKSQTKGDYYNIQGRKQEQNTQTLSAIIEDA